MHHVVVLSAPDEIIDRVNAMHFWITQRHYVQAVVSSRGTTINAEFRERAQAEAFASAFLGRLM
jgi:hypothetical protein